jgi:hypothetical protein
LHRYVRRCIESTPVPASRLAQDADMQIAALPVVSAASASLGKSALVWQHVPL